MNAPFNIDPANKEVAWPGKSAVISRFGEITRNIFNGRQNILSAALICFALTLTSGAASAQSPHSDFLVRMIPPPHLQLIQPESDKLESMMRRATKTTLPEGVDFYFFAPWRKWEEARELFEKRGEFELDDYGLLCFMPLAQGESEAQNAEYAKKILDGVRRKAAREKHKILEDAPDYVTVSLATRKTFPAGGKTRLYQAALCSLWLPAKHVMADLILYDATMAPQADEHIIDWRGRMMDVNAQALENVR